VGDASQERGEVAGNMELRRTVPEKEVLFPGLPCFSLALTIIHGREKWRTVGKAWENSIFE